MSELVLDASAAIVWLLGENDTLARRVAVLAVRKRRPLGTHDAALASAARKSGVKLAFD